MSKTSNWKPLKLFINESMSKIEILSVEQFWVFQYSMLNLNFVLSLIIFSLILNSLKFRHRSLFFRIKFVNLDILIISQLFNIGLFGLYNIFFGLTWSSYSEPSVTYYLFLQYCGKKRIIVDGFQFQIVPIKALRF